MEQFTAKLKQFWEKLKNLLKKIPKKVRILIVVALVALVGVIVFFQMSQPYTVLFTGLSSDEAASIMSYLDNQGATGYRLENNDTILVPKGQEDLLKARLLMEGYPKTGFSYSTYYDHVGALSTESERNTAYLLTLQERMGAVVRCFDGVKDAAVTISPGEGSNYVLDSSNKVGASAAVFVTMRDGQMLTDQQAEAIRTLVARGVQGLEISSVSISDSLGNLYTEGNSNSSTIEASDLKLYLEQRYNNIIRTNVMQVLVPLFGEENVKVGINCNVDVNRTIQDIHDVTLPDWAADGSTKGEGIIGSKIYDHSIVRKGDQTTGGTVGTTTNSDLSSYVEQGGAIKGDEDEIHTSGQIDYDNSTTDTHVERTAGYLTDCMVSVSINSTTAGAMSQAELANLRLHVARAAGISDELTENKISLFSSPFYVEPGPLSPITPDSLESWLVYAVAGAAAFLLLLFIVLLLLRRRGRKKRKKAAAFRVPEEVYAAAYAAPQPEPVGADVMSLQSERNMELRKDIRKFADDNPEIAAQMVRTLLRGGESDG